MTEQEWSICSDPVSMLVFLRDRLNHRKRWLFGCACCRLIWHLLTRQRLREAVEMAERYADGTISQEDMAVVQAEIHAAVEVFGRGEQPTGEVPQEALLTVFHAVWGGGWQTSKSAARCAWESNRKAQAAIVRDLLGPMPFRPVPVDPSWLTSTVLSLAQTIYDERVFDRMPILGDALEEAGCTNQEILAHCRGSGPHVRGCWVVDLLLGKE